MHRLGWRVGNTIFGLDPSDRILLLTVTATVTSAMTTLQRKSSLIQKWAEMIIWDHRNGWCYWGKRNHFNTALWHLFLLNLKQETKLSWFSLLFQIPSESLCFLPCLQHLIVFLFCCLTAIVVLKSAKCFGYSLYVGCCTKSSCVSVWRYNENTFLGYVFFFCYFSLQVWITSSTPCWHDFLLCINIHL